MKTSTSSVYENVVEDVINNVRDEFISDGPGKDVLEELRGVWKTKMKQEGVVNGSINKPGGPITLVRDLNVPYDATQEYETPEAEFLFPPTIFGRPVNVDGRDRVDTGTSQQSRTQNFLTLLSSGKRKREDSASPPKRFIPQQDGAGDVSSCIFAIQKVGETGTPHGICGILSSENRTNSSFKPKSSLGITQKDGLMSDPCVDVLSTPNIHNYHGGFNEDYNIANTQRNPNDLLNTLALPSENDIAVDDDDDDEEEEEPPLNDWKGSKYAAFSFDTGGPGNTLSLDKPLLPMIDLCKKL